MPTPPALSPEAWALRQRVIDAPGEQAARSVYADYLIQRGDRTGEFIAMQLAGADADAAALLPQVEAFVVGVAPRPAVRWTIRRGFVEAIQVFGGELVREPRGLARLLQFQPVREVEFIGRPSDEARAIVVQHGLTIV